MIPFQKIFTVLIRTFSRPMLGYVKRKQRQKKLNLFGGFFVGLGRKSLAFDSWMNHRFIKSSHKKPQIEPNEEFLLQKGVQSFYEVIFYLIVLGLPFYELYKGSLASQAKEHHLQKRILTLQKKMDQINHKLVAVINLAKRQNKQNQRITAKKAPSDRLSKQLDSTKIMEDNIPYENDNDPKKKQEQSSEKIEEILQNALDVMADQFEESLDDVDFQPTSSEEVGADDVDQGDISEMDSQDVQDVDLDTSQPDLDIDSSPIQVDSLTDSSIDMDDVSIDDGI